MKQATTTDDEVTRSATRRRNVAGVFVAVLMSGLLFVPPAQAEPSRQVVPNPWEYCAVSWPGLSTCRAKATALTDGTADAEMSIVSPQDGTLPERDGHGLAVAWFTVPFTVRKPVLQIPVSVTVHVNAASTSWSSATESSGPGHSQVLLQAFLGEKPPCTCFAGSGDVVLSEVASPGTGRSVQNQDVTLSFVVQNSDGSPLPKGNYAVTVRNYAIAKLGDGTLRGGASGDIRAVLDAHLTNISIG